MGDQGARMRQNRSAVAQPEDRPKGPLGAEEDPEASERPPVDETVIEQLASITDSQGYSVLGELLNAFLTATSRIGCGTGVPAMSRLLCLPSLTSRSPPAPRRSILRPLRCGLLAGVFGRLIYWRPDAATGVHSSAVQSHRLITGQTSVRIRVDPPEVGRGAGVETEGTD